MLLHGDGGQAPLRLVEAWERLAAPRGIALLALACPRDLGCQGSWWQWDGDPAWLGEQVRAASTKVAIDPARVALVGWSGGASYLGRRLEDLGPPFSAVVFHGGGIPPAGAPCAARPLPTYFLVGDENPLHHLAVRLRDEARRCGHAVAWDLVPGADHAGEWKAQVTRGEAVLGWLATPRAPIDAGREAGDAGASPRATEPSARPAPRETSAPSPPAPAPPPRARSGCATATATTREGTRVPVALAVLALLGRRRRPRRRRSAWS